MIGSQHSPTPPRSPNRLSIPEKPPALLRFFFLFLLFWSFYEVNAAYARTDVVHPITREQTPYFEWSDRARVAYEKVLQLRFREAQSYINRLKINEPDNLIVHHIENYRDFFTVYLNEDQAEFNRLERNKDDRLNAIEEGDEDSPYYLYLQANIRLQWALARLKFREYATAVFEINKAYKLLVKNQKRFPDFMPNRKDLGILHALAGTVPENYRWAMELLTALDGTYADGRRELEEVIAYAQSNDFVFEKELYVSYAYLLLQLGKDDAGAWNVIREGDLSPDTSPMDCFVMANMAMRSGRNDRAIELLLHRPAGRTFHPFPYLDFMLGNAKLRRGDADADVYLKKYLAEHRGKNFLKETYQRLAWYALLNGNPNGYQSYLREVDRHGTTDESSDAVAQRAYDTQERPDPDLLRARLLFDGGYLDRSYELLTSMRNRSFAHPALQLEYTYRFARLTHEMGRTDEALDLYQQTILHGRDRPEYYACRAALERGHIYEQRRNREAARRAFHTCLDIDPDEHRSDLHHKAKAGLSRL